MDGRNIVYYGYLSDSYARCVGHSYSVAWLLLAKLHTDQKLSKLIKSIKINKLFLPYVIYKDI